MSKCIDCGKKQGMFDAWYDVRCQECHIKWSLENDEQVIRQQQALIEESAAQDERDAQINTVTITTETASNLNITKRLDIVTSQAAFEINQFKDVVVGFLDPVKGRSSELEKQLDTLKERSLYSLKEKAFDLGATGIVAVDLDISTVTIGQISMLMMVASGTAVVIEDK